jgi:predicted nucleic acid-binding protein
MPLVIDASVTLAWCLDDEQSEYADVILKRVSEDSAMVPSVWPIEVANGLLIAERRGRLSAPEIPRLHSLLSDFPIHAEEPALESALGPVISLARTHDLSAYDASYLELAMREGIPLATLDDALRAAAGKSGVALAE